MRTTHRPPAGSGSESHIVDPASIAVDRRHRQTDAIDGVTLLRTLMA